MPKMQRLLLGTFVVICMCVGHRSAMADEPCPRLGDPTIVRWQIGVRVTATGACTGIVATLPIPMDWPEQQVRLVSQEASPQVRPLTFQTVPPGGAKQVVVTIPRLAAGESAQVVLTFEVTKCAVLGPETTDDWSIPERPGAALRPYLGASPMIETSHPEIARLASEIGADTTDGWTRARGIYDWVRANIRYEFDPQLRGALTALRVGHGDCEEMTSLFIALCRGNGIPARSVWIPGHCYPEFYLQDPEGRGCWFPCQAAGAEAFGTMTEQRPILQKGDSFRVAGESGPKRYVAETLRAKNCVADPRVQWLSRRLDD